jgi:hypothetical protein
MKKLFTLMIVALAVAIVACEKKTGDEPTPGTEPDAATLSFQPASIAAAKTAGTYAVTVTSNTAWTVATNSAATAWCTLSPTSGTGNGAVTVNVAANPTLDARAATITFTVGVQQKSLTVTQAAGDPALTAAPAAIAAAVAAGSYTIAVASNTVWTAAVNSAATAWCTLTETSASGNGNGEITVNVAENTATETRTATVTVTTGSLTATTSLTQAAATSGTTGACTWELTGVAGSYTLTISGNGAMANYTYANPAPWYSCQNGLKTVVIQDGVTTIGDYAFSGYYHYGLTGALIIPNSVTTIGESAFYGCAHLTSVTIPNSVTFIGYQSFFCCYGLTGALIIPNSVTTISSSAFTNCYGLTGALIIPNSVTTIGSEAFIGCEGLTAINVDAGNPAYSSIDGVLCNKDQTTLVCCPGGKAGSYTIPNSVTTIGSYAFFRCYRLTSVTIHNSVTSIGGVAFSGCTGLTSVTIGSSITAVGNVTFNDCTGLTSVTSLNTTPPYASDSFRNVNTSACTLRVPASAVAAYQAAAGWSAFGTIEGI